MYSFRALPKRIWNRWLSRSGVDFLIVALVIAVHAVLYARGNVHALLGGIPRTSRPGLYSASAIVVSLTGTLASITVGQYLSAKGSRMAYLKAAFPGGLGRTWRAIFFGSIIAVTSFLIAYGIDSRSAGRPLGTWVFEAGALLALLRLLRLTVLFGELVAIIIQDEVDDMDDADFDLVIPEQGPRSAA